MSGTLTESSPQRQSQYWLTPDDARLLRAAPELLAACKAAISVLGSELLDDVFKFCAVHGYRYSGPSVNIAELRDAIAKAEGRTIGTDADLVQPGE